MRWLLPGLLGGALAACQPAPPAPASSPPPGASSPAPVASGASCVWREVARLRAEAEQSRALDVDRFVDLSRQAAALAPLDASLAASIAAALARKELWHEATTEARRAADLDPSRADYWEQWAALSAQPTSAETPWKDAEEGARRCVALDPRRAECHQILGQARRQAGDERGALVALDAAVRQAPDQLRYRVSLAEVYARLEEPDRAVAVIDDGLLLAPASDPDQVPALVALGAALQQQGDLPRALATLEKAKVADSETRFPEILLSLGLLHARSTPPRRQESLQYLKAFMRRACKGAKAVRYARQCEMAQTTAMAVGAGQE